MAEKTMHHAVIGADTFELIDEAGREETSQLKNALIVTNASGEIASFPDGGDGFPVRDLKVQMEPIQAGSGDPSPDNVRPISGRSSVTVTRTGFNMWDEEWALGYWNYINNGAFVPNNNFFACKNKIKILPNTTYCWKSPAMVRECLFYDQNEDYVSRETPSTSSEVTYFTSPSNACYMTFYYGSTYGTTYNHDISINYPSTDTAYHAYDGQSIEIQLGQTVYGGTLDVTNGVLTVTHANITSYSGETLPGRWISSMDVYTAGGTPTTGAQVVYELAQPVTVQLTAQQLTTLLGQNNVWSDADSVSVDYVADTKRYISKVIADALS